MYGRYPKQGEDYDPKAEYWQLEDVPVKYMLNDDFIKNIKFTYDNSFIQDDPLIKVVGE